MAESNTKAWVYILASGRNGRYYIGHTTNIEQRLVAHERGVVKSTRHLRPWVLMYQEEHPTPAAARRREWYLKRLKSRRALEELMASGRLPVH